MSRVPAANRKGIKHVQDNGMTVQMFERDLQGVDTQEKEKSVGVKAADLAILQRIPGKRFRLILATGAD